MLSKQHKRLSILLISLTAILLSVIIVTFLKTLRSESLVVDSDISKLESGEKNQDITVVHSQEELERALNEEVPENEAVTNQPLEEYQWVLTEKLPESEGTRYSDEDIQNALKSKM